MRTSLNSSLEAELVETFLLWYSCFYSSANAIAVWGVSPYQCLRVPDANSHSFEVKLYHTSVYDQYSHLSWRKYQCLYRECWFQTLFVCVLVRNVWLLWRLQFSHSVPEVCGSRFCRIARTFHSTWYILWKWSMFETGLLVVQTCCCQYGPTWSPIVERCLSLRRLNRSLPTAMARFLI